MVQRLIAGTYVKFRKKLQVAMKENSLLKIIGIAQISLYVLPLSINGET